MYKLYNSFGGKLIGAFETFEQAANAAVNHTSPCDVWNTAGGYFGMGQVVQHFEGMEIN